MPSRIGVDPVGAVFFPGRHRRTHQVKEDILTRPQELGGVVEGGRLGFRPDLFRRAEPLTTPATFRCVDVAGAPIELSVIWCPYR